MQKRCILTILLVSSVSLAFFAHAYTDDENIRSAYSRYISSYLKWREAIEQGLSESETGALLEKVKSDRAEYEKLLKDRKIEAIAPSGRICEEKPVVISGSENNESGGRITDISDSLAEISKNTRIKGKPLKLAKIIQTLENIIRQAPDNLTKNTARLELAYVYQKFTKEWDKADELLQKVIDEAEDPSLREKAEKARLENANDKTLAGMIRDIAGKKDVAIRLQQEYHKVSWFNPVKKVKSYFTYLKSRIAYKKAVALERKFQAETTDVTKSKNPFDMSGIIAMFNLEFDVKDVFDAIDYREGVGLASVRLLAENVDAWYARWMILSGAKRSIDITYFILDKDIFGYSLLGLLYQKAKEGVLIRLMIDARGVKQFSKTLLGQDYLQKLMAYPNCEVKVYNPFHASITAAFDNIRNLIGSNHEKIIVVDDMWAITGGRNIAAHYFVSEKDVYNVYRDTDVLLKGHHVASQMSLMFLEEFQNLNNFHISKDLFGNWSKKEKEMICAAEAMEKWMNGEGLYDPATDKERAACRLEDWNEELEKYKELQTYKKFVPFLDRDLYPVKILAKHSYTGDRNDITDNLITFIDMCTSEIIIQNPYVILTDKAKAALKRASDRGVKIIVHTNSPDSTDSVLTQAFFLVDWKQVMASIRNMRVFTFYKKRKLHAKMFIFDRAVTCIGTYNMDNMSEQINAENMAVIKSERFAKICRDRTMEDIADSKEYQIEVTESGEIKVINGPDDFCDPAMMKKLYILMKFGFLKPLV